jgi:putative oxidoreductase
MPAFFTGKGRTVATWTLRVVLGLIFLEVGITKLAGTGNTIDYFEAIGWGQWFRYLTGVLDIAGAALLFIPRWTCYGAIVLTGSVGLGTLISLTVLRGNPIWGVPVMILIPLILTLLAAVLALLTRPHRLS